MVEFIEIGEFVSDVWAVTLEIPFTNAFPTAKNMFVSFSVSIFFFSTHKQVNNNR